MRAGGHLSFNLILTVYTFDMAVSHLCPTRTEREREPQGRDNDGRERMRDADGGAIGRKGADTGVGWGGGCTVGSKLRGLTG